MTQKLIPSKTCSKCKTRKPIGEFSDKKTGKYGKRNECKECQAKADRKYYLKNRKKINQKAKDKRKLKRVWKKKPSAYLLEKCREYYEENYPPEVIREWYGE